MSADPASAHLGRMDVTHGTLRSTATLAADLDERLAVIRAHIAVNDLLRAWRDVVAEADALAYETVGGVRRTYTFYDAPVHSDFVDDYDRITITDPDYVTLSGTDRDGDLFDTHLPFDFLIEETRERAVTAQHEESLAWARRDLVERAEQAERAAAAAARAAARTKAVAASYASANG